MPPKKDAPVKKPAGPSISKPAAKSTAGTPLAKTKAEPAAPQTLAKTQEPPVDLSKVVVSPGECVNLEGVVQRCSAALGTGDREDVGRVGNE